MYQSLQVRLNQQQQESTDLLSQLKLTRLEASALQEKCNTLEVCTSLQYAITIYTIQMMQKVDSPYQSMAGLLVRYLHTHSCRGSWSSVSHSWITSSLLRLPLSNATLQRSDNLKYRYINVCGLASCSHMQLVCTQKRRITILSRASAHTRASAHPPILTVLWLSRFSV